MGEKTNADLSYCSSLTEYTRVPTREVMVGNLGIGGNNPIRIQSMTTTDTMNTEATVAQSIRMIEVGCELIRITAPSKNEALNLQKIADQLHEQGFYTPLVADIHFTPNAAEIAAGIVEKVRVNPGNYADKKKFEALDFSDESYRDELARIRKRFEPLVLLCKKHNRAMRIGTNHGSLSDRIMSRYGDTPLGMVESALEFVRICEDNDFFNIVLSMKASNTLIMVQAYRLLNHKMALEGMNYPLHLGVTEAGDGEDGRIKSAVGIGALLEDGIGDTIRVSLTEEPEAEMPVAIMLAERYANRGAHPFIPELTQHPVNPFAYQRRSSRAVANIGDRQVPVVVHDLSTRKEITPATLFSLGYSYSVPLDKWNLSDAACDFIYTGSTKLDFHIPGTLGVIIDAEPWATSPKSDRHYPLFSAKEYQTLQVRSKQINFVSATLADLDDAFKALLQDDPTVVLILETSNPHGMAEQRRAFVALIEKSCDVPVIIKRSYSNLDEEHTLLYAATDIGALYIDGLGDGILLSNSACRLKMLNDTSFGILQATRTRISKTEYISCPSCGRTLFDLQETTAKIRARTNHLKGIKIGIMGCIVNGPGEMADADYGYVGTGVGKITLYKEKEVVQRSVPEAQAVDALIELIRSHGDWVDEPTID